MNEARLERITLIIADDHPFFRSGVRHELERLPRFAVLAETGDGEDALRLIAEHRPDVAIIDYEMPKLTGIELARKAEAAGYPTRIIMLTMHRLKQIFFAALEAGVSGFVLKDDAIADIVRAVDSVAAGDHFINKDLTGYLLEKAHVRIANDPTRQLLHSLTDMERKTLLQIAEFKTNSEIAEVLCLSKRTVENYKSTIADKLNLQSARHILRFALENKDKLS